MMMIPQNGTPQFQPTQMRQPSFPRRPSSPAAQWQGTPRNPRRPIFRNPNRSPIAKRKQTPKQVFRMQSPDPQPVKQARLSMPAPEQLGLVASAEKQSAALDWNAVWSRLKQMKASGIRVTNQQDGQVRVTLIMPNGKSKQQFQIEATAANETQAVTAALHRAEQWARSDR